MDDLIETAFNFEILKTHLTETLKTVYGEGAGFVLLVGETKDSPPKIISNYCEDCQLRSLSRAGLSLLKKEFEEIKENEVKDSEC